MNAIKTILKDLSDYGLFVINPLTKEQLDKIENRNKSIAESIKAGEVGEDIVVSILEHILFRKVINPNVDERLYWDKRLTHWIYEGEYEFEVKTDWFVDKGKKDKNFFVEVERNNKASGIMVTQADFFVYHFFNEKKMYFIKSGQLKDLIDGHEIRIKDDITCFIKYILLDVDTYKNNFTEINYEYE